jgi:hypothetical protein
MNRTKRKSLARFFKKHFALERIPDAKEDSIAELSERAEYEYQYEKYANW